MHYNVRKSIILVFKCAHICFIYKYMCVYILCIYRRGEKWNRFKILTMEDYGFYLLFFFFFVFIFQAGYNKYKLPLNGMGAEYHGGKYLKYNSRWIKEALKQKIKYFYYFLKNYTERSSRKYSKINILKICHMIFTCQVIHQWRL